MRRITRITAFLIITLAISACASIKPWERVYLNDPQMQLGNNTGKNFSNYVHSIREGSIPGGSTKSSGGCGCN
jgi:hypothetical protein